MNTPLLKIEHLEVRYGDLIGVSDVSLEVPEGSVVALLGSNGGGKTTTLNAIAGLIPSHSGSIQFRGEEIGGDNAYAIVRKGLALSPEGWRLFVQQSVENNLLLGATPLKDKSRRSELLDRVYEIFPRLKERRAQRAGTMSGGERQMLAVGRALMSDPKQGLSENIIMNFRTTLALSCAAAISFALVSHASAEDKVKIGVIFPMTGNAASAGIHGKAGARSRPGHHQQRASRTRQFPARQERRPCRPRRRQGRAGVRR